MLRILVVDDLEDIRELISVWLHTQFGAQVVTAPSGNAAIKILASDRAFNCIISDFSMPDGNGGDVLHFMVRERIATPFVLCSTEPPSSYKEFASIKPSAHVIKFEAIKTLRLILERVLPELRPGAGGAQAQTYFPLPLKRLKGFSERTLTDLHIPLAKNQFAKVYAANSAWDAPPLIKGAAGALDPLWIQASDLTHYFREWTAQVNFKVEKESLSTAASLKYSVEAVQWIHQISQELGFTPELQQVADTCARLAARTIQRDPHFESLVKDLTEGKENYLVSHCTALSHLACGLAARAGIESEERMYRLSLAALLHDMSLTNGEIARVQTLEELKRRWGEFTPEQHEAFRRHPEASAKLASAHPGLPNDVIEMILSHHERPDGSGFPRGQKAGDFSELTALFVIAHAVLSLLTHPVHRADSINTALASLQGSWREGTFGSLLQKMGTA